MVKFYCIFQQLSISVGFDFQIFATIPLLSTGISEINAMQSKKDLI